jgi:hypothetical protein
VDEPEFIVTDENVNLEAAARETEPVRPGSLA